MTDRVNTITVALESDIREDDAQSLISAIMQMRGVLSASLNVADVQSYVSDMRARIALVEKVTSLLRDFHA